MAEKLKLYSDNYYSVEANKAYLSASFYKAALKCEASAMHQYVIGDYIPVPSTAFIVGNYVHAWSEGLGGVSQEHTGLGIFQSEHPEIFKRDGTLKSEYVQANAMISALKRQPLIMKYLDNGKKTEHESIRTGKLFGAPWKIKVDSLHFDKDWSIKKSENDTRKMVAFIDLKTVRDIYEQVYVEGLGRVPWFNAYGYITSGAIYQKILGEPVQYFIVAISKSDTPMPILLKVPQYLLDMELEIVEKRIKRVVDVWSGKVEPARCGRCEYCASTVDVNSIVSIDDLFGEE